MQQRQLLLCVMLAASVPAAISTGANATGSTSGSSDAPFTYTTDNSWTYSSASTETDASSTTQLDEFGTAESSLSSDAFTDGTTDFSDSTNDFSGSTSDFFGITSDSTDATDDYSDSTDATDDYSDSTDATDDYSDSTDATDDYSDSTDATDDYSDSTDATDDYSDSTDATDGTTDETTDFVTGAEEEATTDQEDNSTVTSETTTDDPSTTTTAPWWVTTPRQNYSWTEPTAWSSPRLYPFGPTASDTDMLENNINLDRFGKCERVRLNGRVGAAFYSNRFYNIYVCNNGLLTFNQEIREPNPSVFGSKVDYANTPLIAPFWGLSDEVTLSLLTNWPEAHSRVYYRVYDTRTADSADVLERARLDVANSDEGISGFQPTWVLVVTWLNLPYLTNNCRSTSIAHFRTNSSVGTCASKAEDLAVNHFQAVFITDGVYSFVKFNYPAGGINWAYPGIITSNVDELSLIADSAQSVTGIAVGGLSSGDGFPGTRYNLTSSNSYAFVNIDDTAGNLKDGSIGEFLFRVETSNGTKTPQLKCIEWADQQDVDVYNKVVDAMPCPTNIYSMFIEALFGRFSYHNYDAVTELECFSSSFARRGIIQQCCYSGNLDSWIFGALIHGSPNGGYVSNLNEQANETEAYNTCCVEANMCSLFYEGRPSSDGTGYRPPVFWPWFGDPHIITSDGFGYTFNGLGEYLFTSISDNDTVIQARTERVVSTNGTLGQATYFSAVCVNTTGLPRVQLQLNKNNNLDGVENELQLLIDGVLKDISLIEQDSNVTQTLDGVDPGLLFKRTNASVTVLFSSGVTVTAAVAHKMISITLGLPSSALGATIGLTGPYDGDQSNDLTYPNRTVQISTNSSEMEIFDWASSFAVSEEDSLMYYTDNTSWYTYNNNSFVPAFTDNIDSWVWSTEEFKNSAYEACQNDTSCLYDVYVTGSLAIGQSTKSTAEDSASNNNALSNYAPIINGDDSLMVVVGETWFYSFTVNDSNGDAFTIETNVNAVVSIDGTEVNVTGTVTNATGFSLIVTAKDPSGAAGTKTPLAMICNCANGGTCDALSQQLQAEVETASITLDCICPTGYTGDLCDTDLDACALVASPCYPTVLCVDSPAPADHEGYTCGDCPAGYTGDGKTCSDVDECEGNVCDHICINSPGSFVCACRTGYSLNTDGSTCDDIDECLTDPCHQVCNNTEGSYVCGCESGFVLSDDNINCEPANPCADPNPCDSTNGYCNVVGDTQECSCKKGYTLNANGTTCDEIDECLLGIDFCAQNCTNTVGGYSCDCQPGYSLASNGMDCNDVNECVLNTYNCHVSQICSNTVGGYECTCSVDQILTNGTCQNIVYTDPVAIESADTPIDESYVANSVSFSLLGMTIAEYTVEKEITLFTLLASSASSVCSSNTCSANRKKRSTSSVTFYKEYFSRLPGYPQYDSNGDLQLAIYTLVPGTGVLSGQLLKQVVQDVSLNISASLGAEMSAIVLHVQTTTASTTEAPTTAATSTEMSAETTPENAKKDLTGVYIAVGVVLGLLLIAAVVIIVLLKLKNSKNAKTNPINDSEEPRQPSPVAAVNYKKTDPESIPLDTAATTSSPVGGANTATSRPTSAQLYSSAQPATAARLASATRPVTAAKPDDAARPASAAKSANASRPVSVQSKHSVEKSRVVTPESSAEQRPGSSESFHSGKQSLEHSRVATPLDTHPKVD